MRVLPSLSPPCFMCGTEPTSSRFLRNRNDRSSYQARRCLNTTCHLPPTPLPLPENDATGRLHNQIRSRSAFWSCGNTRPLRSSAGEAAAPSTTTQTVSGRRTTMPSTRKSRGKRRKRKVDSGKRRQPPSSQTEAGRTTAATAKRAAAPSPPGPKPRSGAPSPRSAESGRGSRRT